MSATVEIITPHENNPVAEFFSSFVASSRASSRSRSNRRAKAELERERDEARKPAAWIPVARALPDDDATVLIHLADGEVWTGFLDAGHWRFVSGDRIETPVLHWRPFPDAPKPSK